MSHDIEVGIAPPSAPAADDPALLSPLNTREQAMLASYDFLKHVSGLSLIAMGGMLGLAQGLSAKPSPAILMSVGIVGLSGFMSLVFMAGIAATQIRQVVHKSSNAAALIIVMIVLMLFAAGLGMFIGTFFHEVRHA